VGHLLRTGHVFDTYFSCTGTSLLYFTFVIGPEGWSYQFDASKSFLCPEDRVQDAPLCADLNDVGRTDYDVLAKILESAMSPGEVGSILTARDHRRAFQGPYT